MTQVGVMRCADDDVDDDDGDPVNLAAAGGITRPSLRHQPRLAAAAAAAAGVSPGASCLNTTSQSAQFRPLTRRRPHVRHSAAPDLRPADCRTLSGRYTWDRCRRGTRRVALWLVIAPNRI